MRVSAVLLSTAILMLAGCASQGSAEAENLAIESATAWLELIDNEQYAVSWNESASYFKSAITQEGWETTVGPVREPLGPVISRKLKSKTYTNTLPGAPDGEYVVIRYDTEFENKKSAVETITPMLDSDGQWRVSGYYVN